MRKKISRLVLLTFLLCISSCASIELYEVSIPVLEDGTKLRHGLIEGDDFFVVVRPSNQAINLHKKGGERNLVSPYYRYHSKRTSFDFSYRDTKSFYIELAVFLNDEKGQLDPEKFVLDLGEKKFSGKLYGPFDFDERHLRHFYVLETPVCELIEKGDDRYLVDNYNLKENKRVLKPLTLEAKQKYCFVLKFDSPPPQSDSTTFKLILDGLDIKSLPSEIGFKPYSYYN